MVKIFLSIPNAQKHFLTAQYAEWLLNDYDVYRCQRELIEKSLEKKLKKNIYDREKAKKAYYNLAYAHKLKFINLIKTAPYYRMMLEDNVERVNNLEKVMLEQVASELVDKFENDFFYLF